jgi:hypothetical protein
MADTFTSILHNSKSATRRLLAMWGTVPLLLMLDIDWGRGPLVLIGTADRMMWPLLPPGSLLQLDQNKRIVDDGPFNEFDRPIYLIEYRNRFYCCHAKRRGRDAITMISHGESNSPPSTSISLKEAKVRGQVTPIFLPLPIRSTQKAHRRTQKHKAY